MRHVYLSINKYYEKFAEEEQIYHRERYVIMGFSITNYSGSSILCLPPDIKDTAKKINLKMIYENHCIEAGEYMFFKYTGNVQFRNGIQMLIAAACELGI